MIILVCYKLIDLIVQSDFQIQVYILIRNFVKKLVKLVIELVFVGHLAEASVCSRDCFLFD